MSSRCGARLCGPADSIERSSGTWQSLQQKPKAHGQLEEEDRSSINPNADDLGKLGKNNERECACSHQKGRKHSPRRQCSWDIPRLEPQITKQRASKSGKHQAHAISGAMTTHRSPGQCLQSIRLKYSQVIDATQQAQNLEVIEQGDNKN